jgi:glucokinase
MDGPLLLGIEIGGTKLQLGLGLGDGRLLALQRRGVEPRQGGEGVRRQIIEVYETLQRSDAVAAHGPIAAAGIGFGGPVDRASGRVHGSHHVEGWERFPLADWVQRELGIPRAILRNDSDTAALGEVRFGAGQGISPLLYVNSGSGVGGGLVLDGRIYPGNDLGAIEIGHLVIEEDRTLESIASGWAIGREGAELVRRSAGRDGPRPILVSLAGGDPGRVTAQLVAQAALEGDPAASAILDRATRAMGQALAHAVTLLAPRRVVLGGGVSLLPDHLWREPIARVLDQRVFKPFRGTYDVVTARLGEAVVVHGALALAREPGAETGEANPGSQMRAGTT